jgi:hypothetical protein
MSDRPILLFGQRGSMDLEDGSLFQYGAHHHDGDVPVALQTRTAEVAIAGVGGRASFKRLFVAITFTAPFHLRLTPIVDGNVPAGEYADIEITAADYGNPASGLVLGARRTHLFEVTLSLPYLRGGQSRFRHDMQGSYFQVEITQPTPMTLAGELIVEQVELEYKVLTRGSVQ